MTLLTRIKLAIRQLQQHDLTFRVMNLHFLFGLFAITAFALPTAKKDEKASDQAAIAKEAELRGRGRGRGHDGRRGGFDGGRDFWNRRNFHSRADGLIGRRFGRWGGGRAKYYHNWSIDRGMCGRIPRVGNVASISYEYMPQACGRCVMVRHGGTIEKAVIVDVCQGCGPDEVQLSGGMFNRFNRFLGRSLSVDWQFVNC